MPDVSIIILGYKSSAHLPTCMDCLEHQTCRNFEVVFIDNGSGDGSLEIVESRKASFPVHILKQDRNLGFAAANNIGAKLARGKWIALLNADAYPEPDWLASLLRAVDQAPEYSAFSSRQIQFHAPHLLDGAGDAYHISGLAWRNQYNLPAGQNGLKQREVFSPCAAAAMYLREEFLKAGGFDEDYFSYFEDVDLGFRLRLLGTKCLYVPEAVVQHVGSASTGKRSNFSVYYGYRNLIWTFFKDMPSPWIWLFLPLHIGTVLFFSIYLTLRGQGGTIWQAIFDAMRGLPKILGKRKIIQKNKQIVPGEALRFMSRGLFQPVREFIKRNRTA